MITLTVIFFVLAFVFIIYGIVMVSGSGNPESAYIGLYISITGLVILGLEVVIWGIRWIVVTLP